MTWARAMGKCQVGEENENALGGGAGPGISFPVHVLCGKVEPYSLRHF